uniref:ThiF family adenylyltransferase n=1 Tax=Catenulispora pinisilvae TaxID=2705253 RepID=UPI001E537868
GEAAPGGLGSSGGTTRDTDQARSSSASGLGEAAPGGQGSSGGTTRDTDQAAGGGQAGSSSGAAVESPASPLFARTRGILSPELADRRVLVVGAGSVGSYLVEVLARSGVGAFTIVDPDVVEAVNVGRSAFRVADVGLGKA